MSRDKGSSPSARGIILAMEHAFFVTGTDTGVGKTHVSAALLRGFNAHGKRALGMKPVASGCQWLDDAWRNDDALALLEAGAYPLDYALLNPYALPEAIAPHSAAALHGIRIEMAPIAAAYAQIAAQAEIVVVEGAGGWMVPLSDSLMEAAIPQQLGLPVLLVVGLRLGCINHGLLSARAIRADGCELRGWIANHVDAAMENMDDSVATLDRLLGAPLLGHIRHVVAICQGQYRAW